MQASRNTEPLERQLLDETLADCFEHGHLLSRPFDLALAGIGQPHVLHITFFQFSDWQSLAPQSWISFGQGVTPKSPVKGPHAAGSSVALVLEVSGLPRLPQSRLPRGQRPCEEHPHDPCAPM